ncbi:hypothetical protein WUBG_02099 [Wuchereria bancrofti]|uniref:DUF7808 domain-containing protein n=2 Tax=Wuchereria bancrofti TaxID=6293 RepID=J9EWI3_WUCBA|nr:hypothetical protein WUBG_02099 [Wuchereria bancrofti]
MSVTWYFILMVTYVLVSGQNRKETLEGFKWPRWEERTIDCTTQEKEPDQCTLIARNAKIPRDPTKYKCRREEMPVNSRNILAQNSTRLACPIGCESDTKLSVLVKSPQNNHLCQKYYTYGKYRDREEGEWYLWLTEPCRANLTTWCRFKDIPLLNPKIRN